jgi:hypothetical protein
VHGRGRENDDELESEHGHETAHDADGCAADAQPETWVTFQTGDMGNSFSLVG